jgi:hypothetical protein
MKGVGIFWLVLLIPWLVISPLAGMAFDSGYTPAAYYVVSCIWSYPLMVALAFFLKRFNPKLILLPLLNVAGILVPLILDAIGIQ